MAGGVLGFNKDTKKSAVGDYFKQVKATVEGTKDKLNTIVENMEKEGNPNASAVKTKVDELIKNKLSKIIEGVNKVKEAIGDSKDSIGDVAEQRSGGFAGDVEKLVDVWH